MHNRRLCSSFVFVLLLSGSASAKTLVVNNNPSNTSNPCPQATFTSIQSAVLAAAPHDTVLVCPGTYPEQVVVTEPLTITGIESNQNVSAATSNSSSNNDNSPESYAIVIAPVAVANTTDLYDSSPIAAIVDVEGASGVNINHIIVDGSNTPNASCAPDLVGFFYRNSSGTLNQVVSRYIGVPPSASNNQGTITGCQIGLGIFAESGSGGSAHLTVENSNVHDYNKNGITGDTGTAPYDTSLTVRNSVITGSGPTPVIAQNGVQIADGAKGSVTGSTITGNNYSSCTATSCSYVATNILVYNSNNVMVEQNVIGESNVNVYLQGNSNEAESNAVFGGVAYDGIDVIGNGNTVTHNTISRSDNDAVYVCGSNNTVDHARINEASYGIYEDPTCAPSGNKYSGNTLVNVVFEAFPPKADGEGSRATTKPSALASPAR